MSSENGPLVRLKDVTKSFDGHAVLNGLDLEVARGTNFVVMGHSGMGKSVALKIMCGLLAPDAGEVSIDGVRIDGAGARDLRRARERLGFVFQGAALIAWLSARDNVALPLRERGVAEADVRRIVDARLLDVGLADIGDKFPSAISGGMRKRVGFARATILEPALVLYDEPTTGLDPVTTRTIDELIVGARDRLGATGVIVSHDVASALRVGDHIGLLHEGRLDVVLTPSEFVESAHPVVRSFLDAGPAVAGRSSP